ncbi:hypothetical protein M409DRAFT_17369 [Zasmidium cellare ATCC 36951]|uniref:histidine kinase n=1 Tax=Zasmidium cellare ATCC 36951 TaxID=1080233 RepID=A0A6A6D137_ZASCE|nr:uncharacterized protein M409DRAFT_17369 [Zasmidium cellare ATCC 36951]KAF2172128.1 hypothetical protein M409DRAFT_17369 [Zasmidium cellare ATCC 36951]
MPLKSLEAQREHDFHRYLDAVLSISGSVPTYCDLNDPAAVEAHEPCPSPDTALTAFCQLAAYRLRTKRAMLFFFDVTHAFVLAEATRTLSLAGEEVHHVGDPLWLGFTTIPRGFSVCEQTISIVAPALGPACSSKPVNVISDLSEDTRFCGRPYVQSSPHARFHAGVPITSPEGINIGAFCVLDDCKREDLTDIEKEFMRDISATIMTHLTLVRAKAEQKRETRMVTALGRFVQDSSGLREPKGADEDTENTQHMNPCSANRGTSTTNKCYVLGSSLAYDMPFDATETNITEALLESLLTKYPCGKIWTFEGQGFESEQMTDSANEGSSTNPRRQPSTPGATRDRWERRAHAEEIQRLFPRVRSFGFVGMWDQVRGRWFAGGMFWTSSPFRVLSVESELRYISAFCDVIMTETKRVEAERSDKAKMDFLSSISHELRSPLHGILGSTECLQEQEQSMDVASELLVSQIESCGRTLLDIIDHLLEYSRINFSATPASRPENKQREAKSLEEKQFQHLTPISSTNGCIALDTITEEVIDAAVFSFLSGRDSSSKDTVSVMIDIDSPGSSKWKCQIVTGGWKRICMNIVTNALKYTRRGWIHVGIQTTLIPNSEDQLAAVLTVSDSGNGMTKDFLKNHLFRAFSQEDSLSSGIGLGMNLVAKIVQTLGGKIDVQSEQGVGTRVTVYVPLQQTPFGQGDVAPRTKPTLQKLCRNAVCVVDGVNVRGRALISTRDAIEAKTHTLLIAAIEKSCGQLGLKVCRAGASTSSKAQLNIILQKDLMDILQHSKSNAGRLSLGQKPLIVVCESSQAERKLRKSKMSFVAGQIVEYLAQPCGPTKLERAIVSCLTRQSSIATASMTKRNMEKKVVSTTEPHETSKDPQLLRILPSRVTTLPSRPASPSPEVPPAKDELVLLLVDDNPVNLQLLKTYASKRGLPRHLASNGLEALAAYREAHLAKPATSNPGIPNVVMMDISMPICDGFEATKRIRAYEHEHGLKPATIIALTGLGSPDAQREAYTCGFDMFLTKPVQLKKLTALLEELKNDKKRAWV